MRVFIGPVEIAGYYSQLAEALRGIGVDAVAIDLSANRFGYDRTRRLNAWVRAARWAADGFRSTQDGPVALKLLWRAIQLVTHAGLFVWSVWRFDAFIFSFGHTLFLGRDLPLLRLLRKRIVFAFNGTDARPPYIDGADMAPSRGMTMDECITLARRKKARIRRIERHAHAIVSQPTFSHFFERPVVDFFRVGVPWTPREVPERRAAAGSLRVLHSPSDPEVKGSDEIHAVVARLRAAGASMELVELRGVPNDQVRSEIARADFVIDQLYSDAPMVSFATEAATVGVPAIVGGYAWPELRQLYPGELMPPVEQCKPDELDAAVQRLAGDEAYRVALGASARNFVETQWAAARIAERYVAILKGEIPADWLFDPSSLRYVRGVGLPEDRSRAMVGAVIERGGRQALQLSDKPELEQAFADYADGK